MAGETRIVYDDSVYSTAISAVNEVSGAMAAGADAVSNAISVLNSISSAGGSLSSEIGGTVLGAVRQSFTKVEGALSQVKSIAQKLGFAQQVLRGSVGVGIGGAAAEFPIGDIGSVIGGAAAEFPIGDIGSMVGAAAKIWDGLGNIGDAVGKLEDFLGVDILPEDIGTILDIQGKIDNYADNIGDIMDAWNSGDTNSLIENIFDVGGDIISDFTADPVLGPIMGNLGDMAHSYTYADTVITNSNDQLVTAYHNGEAGLGETLGGGIGGSLGGSMMGTLDALTNSFGVDLPDSWTDAAVSFGTTVGQVGGDMIETGVDFVCDVGGALYDFGSDCVSFIGSWFS
ncbi:MAG: hypothetical protein IJA77_09230 [Clostridia bacterium]|nr:hypothetical protein [Clostridia bacterium]